MPSKFDTFCIGKLYIFALQITFDYYLLAMFIYINIMLKEQFINRVQVQTTILQDGVFSVGEQSTEFLLHLKMWVSSYYLWIINFIWAQ